jgi:hypothetical protein
VVGAGDVDGLGLGDGGDGCGLCGWVFGGEAVWPALILHMGWQ